MLNFFHIKFKYQWREDLSPLEWEEMLSNIGGHPLQSASWGEARKKIDNIKCIRLAAFKNDKPVYLARIEERRLFGFLKIAWIPQAVDWYRHDGCLKLEKELFRILRQKGFLFCVMSPWMKIKSKHNEKSPQTIWIDLTVGKEKLWNALSKQCRYDIRRSKKLALIVEKAKSEDDIREFFELCKVVSQSKKFHLNGSAELIKQIQQSSFSPNFESVLFKAKYDGKMCGGAFVIRLGRNLHYMWAASDRKFTGLNIGEAVQWEIIEWALSLNCKLYDLEGIDKKNNLGTYHFKKKFGGEIITMPSRKIYVLNDFIRSIKNCFRIPSFFSLLTPSKEKVD